MVKYNLRIQSKPVTRYAEWKDYSQVSQGFEPKIDVYVVSQEIAAKLPEAEMRLVKESNRNHSSKEDLSGFMEIGFSVYKNSITLASIYFSGILLAKNLSEREAEPVMRREAGRNRLTYVLNGPCFNNKEIAIEPELLDNSQLLKMIVEADRITQKNAGTARKAYSSFRLSVFDGSEGKGVPEICDIQAVNSPVRYHVRGMHMLTPDQDGALFALYWKRRENFGSYGDFKAAYAGFGEAAERIKKVKGEQKGE